MSSKCELLPPWSGLPRRRYLDPTPAWSRLLEQVKVARSPRAMDLSHPAICLALERRNFVCRCIPKSTDKTKSQLPRRRKQAKGLLFNAWSGESGWKRDSQHSTGPNQL